MPSRPRKSRSRNRSRSRRVRRPRSRGGSEKVVKVASNGHGVTTNDWITGAAVLGGTAAMYYANKQRKRAKKAEAVKDSDYLVKISQLEEIEGQKQQLNVLRQRQQKLLNDAKQAEAEAAMLRQEAIDQASKVKNVLRLRVGFERGEREKAEAQLKKIQQKKVVKEKKD